ncbi:capsular polysaccharide biosynthesis protein [Clostridium saccharoperbutylacetonicum]|uniref:Capsular polysaccharide biosynthesis protein n=2 Tax=Clostridium saccharoperbutylacetonicum TaxID=36745 RepID=M1MF14_9CLOT|nr:Wzz/FepE/Etk N-terminal domain-containing protein [Clostridium saccharoperbutylacetonicum]AGF54973.1 capsular polysaccharide biosynthesis protein [Clostridium saccharoperbutylacetonicum N1-4(HMT)]NRT64320.1 capsular polysaccharide biosynthesis protein [Clostridium saccharoperbutylacetonicum]NSB27689.1 capsular polysaccharide biosynthesis protein [Clostridium saccharoperbutylacetonicum]NSB41176.1 capsular polysaccharide biosynthesis protein [Clostridium saccharoperbutylacetonicum]
MNEDIIRIEELIKILKKRWKMIVSITIISTIFSVFMSFYMISPKYEASTKVFIGKENSKDARYSDNDVNMYQKLLKTYVEVISTNNLVEKAIDKEGLDITSEEVLKGLTVAPRADTQILEIKYISEDRILAKDVVDSITDEFIESSTELIPNGDVKIIDKVKIPERPVSPNKKMNIAIAFLLGLMISVGLSFLLDAMNNTLKTKEELERILGLPVIGTIPNELA